VQCSNIGPAVVDMSQSTVSGRGIQHVSAFAATQETEEPLTVVEASEYNDPSEPNKHVTLITPELGAVFQYRTCNGGHRPVHCVWLWYQYCIQSNSNSSNNNPILNPTQNAIYDTTRLNDANCQSPQNSMQR